MLLWTCLVLALRLHRTCSSGVTIIEIKCTVQDDCSAIGKSCILENCDQALARLSKTGSTCVLQCDQQFPLLCLNSTAKLCLPLLVRKMCCKTELTIACPSPCTNEHRNKCEYNIIFICNDNKCTICCEGSPGCPKECCTVVQCSCGTQIETCHDKDYTNCLVTRTDGQKCCFAQQGNDKLCCVDMNGDNCRCFLVQYGKCTTCRCNGPGGCKNCYLIIIQGECEIHCIMISVDDTSSHSMDCQTFRNCNKLECHLQPICRDVARKICQLCKIYVDCKCVITTSPPTPTISVSCQDTGTSMTTAVQSSALPLATMTTPDTSSLQTTLAESTVTQLPSTLKTAITRQPSMTSTATVSFTTQAAYTSTVGTITTLASTSTSKVSTEKVAPSTSEPDTWASTSNGASTTSELSSMASNATATNAGTMGPPRAFRDRYPWVPVTVVILSVIACLGLGFLVFFLLRRRHRARVGRSPVTTSTDSESQGNQTSTVCGRNNEGKNTDAETEPSIMNSTAVMTQSICTPQSYRYPSVISNFETDESAFAFQPMDSVYTMAEVTIKQLSGSDNPGTRMFGTTPYKIEDDVTEEQVRGLSTDTDYNQLDFTRRVHAKTCSVSADTASVYRCIDVVLTKGKEGVVYHVNGEENRAYKSDHTE